jgi:hypothetical protein
VCVCVCVCVFVCVCVCRGANPPSATKGPRAHSGIGGRRRVHVMSHNKRRQGALRPLSFTLASLQGLQQWECVVGASHSRAAHRRRLERCWDMPLAALGWVCG